MSGRCVRGRVTAPSQINFIVQTETGREILVRAEAAVRGEFQTNDEVEVG
jgi:hypothetical protein